jgi:hypothetical protein
VQRLPRVEREDVQHAAATFFSPAAIRRVLVGDWSIIRDAVHAIAKERNWEPIEVHDRTGVHTESD